MQIGSQIDEILRNYTNYIVIGACIVVILLIIVIIAAIKKHSKKETKILSQINDTVTQLNTTFNSIKDRNPEVIYIDNRVSDPDEQKQIIYSRGDDAECVSQAGHTQETDATASKEKDIPKKFFSRDCAVSKTGRVYTQTELQQQIR